MRYVQALAMMIVFVGALLHAKPIPPEKKADPLPAFKPIAIDSMLADDDPKDAKLNFPSRKFPLKLHKDKTYVIDMNSKDFDTYLRLLDSKGKQLAEDDDGGGELNSRIYHSPTESGDFTVVTTTFDGQVGKFSLKVRELSIKGEAKPRPLGKDGLTLNAEIGANDMTDLDKLSKVHSIELKKGQSYLFEVKSEDFDPQIYVFDNKSKLLAQDPEKVACAALADGPYHVVVKSFDGKLGKFDVTIKAFSIKGEPNAREVPRNGLTINGTIGANDKTPLNKLGKIYSIELKAGQSYTITQEGKDLSSYLYLFNSQSALLVQDDGSADPNSRIVFEAPSDGVYHILATTVDGQETGDFSLNVRRKE